MRNVSRRKRPNLIMNDFLLQFIILIILRYLNFSIWLKQFHKLDMDMKHKSNVYFKERFALKRYNL